MTKILLLSFLLNPSLSGNSSKISDYQSKGRPSVSWEDSSERSKRRKCNVLVKSHLEDEVLRAYIKRTQNSNIKKLMKYAISSPSKSGQLIKCIKGGPITQYTADECVDLWISGDHTKESWLLHYRGAKKKECKPLCILAKSVRSKEILSPSRNYCDR